MGNLRVSNEVLLAKVETTSGVDAAPTASANAILMGNPSLGFQGLRMVDRPSIRAFLNPVQQIYAGALQRLTFSVELKGSGTPGTAPEIDPLLRACGMAVTNVAGTSVTYKPRSNGQESATLYYYEGGRKLHKLLGARGNVTFRINSGGLPVAEFEMVGHYVAPTDVSLPTPTYNSQIPTAVINLASMSLGGITNINIREMMIALNNAIATPPSMAAPDGYGEVQITGMGVAGEITMDAELASVIDIDGQLQAGTGLTFTTGAIGANAGNRLTISSATNGLCWRDRQPGEAEGMRIRTMPFGLKDTVSGDDAVSLAFT